MQNILDQIKHSLAERAKTCAPAFKDAITSIVDHLYEHEAICEILSLPLIANDQLETPRPFDEIYAITRIGVCGWAAHTIYDSYQDDEAITQGVMTALGVANFFSDFIQKDLCALGPALFGSDRIERLFLVMYGAHFIEELRIDPIDIIRHSADKSLAVAVPLLCLCICSGMAEESVASCEAYFYHFMLARQLSDDARDWKEDLRSNRITYVTKRMRQQSLTELDDDLRDHVAHLIIDHSNQSIERAKKYMWFSKQGFFICPTAKIHCSCAKYIDISSVTKVECSKNCHTFFGGSPFQQSRKNWNTITTSQTQRGNLSRRSSRK